MKNTTTQKPCEPRSSGSPLPRLVRADAPGIWQLTDNMGNQKTVEVVNDPWATTNDNHERLYVRGKGNGYWPVDSSIFDGWEWSRPNATAQTPPDSGTKDHE